MLVLSKFQMMEDWEACFSLITSCLYSVLLAGRPWVSGGWDVCTSVILFSGSDSRDHVSEAGDKVDPWTEGPGEGMYTGIVSIPLDQLRRS